MSITSSVGTPAFDIAAYLRDKPFAVKVSSSDALDFSEYEQYLTDFIVPDGAESAAILNRIKQSSLSIQAATACGANYYELNRYHDIHPYDDNRLLGERFPPGFYYNASPIEIGGQRYIAAQGPTECSKAHFWQMVESANCQLIITATDVIEKGKLKCEPFWDSTHLPEDVTLDYEADLYTLGEQSITLRQFTNKKMVNKIVQLHYNGWPDMEAPNLRVIRKLFESMETFQGGPNQPIIVNCSAGCGRTGVVIAIHSLLAHLKKDPDSINIPHWIFEMRRQRMHMVQKPAQLQAIYQYIKSHLSEEEESFGSSEDIFELELS